MKDDGRKSPKFYVADGIVLRMREAIAHVIDDISHPRFPTDMHVNSLKRHTFDVLDRLHHSGVITEDEGLELKLKLSGLLNEDIEKRKEKQ